MNKNFYCSFFLVWMLIGFCAPAKSSVLSGESPREINVIPANVTMPPVAYADGVSSVEMPMTPPEFSPEPVYGDQTDIGLSLYNPNPGSSTEIYRSLSETSGFELIATVPWDQNAYFDRNLRPRTDYYYKLRAVKDTEVTDFSEIGRYRTNSKNYPPVLTARAVDENTIELTLEDRSYNDIGYIIRSTSPDNSFVQDISFPADSGATLVVIHEPVNAATQYDYAVDMQTMDEGLPVLRNVASASATTPMAPPEFSPEPVYGDQTDIGLSLYNPNPGSSTEIYRSLSETSGFELIATVPWDQNAYFDRNLRPRTDYYYKLRAVKDTEVTDFSDIGRYRTNSKNYPPVLTARAVDENTIELTLEDRSYNDIGYTIRRTSPDNGYVQDISFPADSGGTQTVMVEPVNPGTSYTYAVDMQTMDEGLPVLRNVTTASVTTPGSTACAGTGSIRWEVWQNETGTEISSVDYYKSPDHTRALTIFESPRYYGTNYGSRVRGYICPPVTGNYTFWISSDDRGELWLSTDDDPIKKVKIASVPGYAPYRNWNKYASQQSAPVMLEAGRRYYIEALHKEISGDDYVSVGWQLPDGTLERPIAGNRLIPFGNPANIAPAIILHEPVEGQVYTEPASVFMFATASPQDTGHPITKVIFYKDTVKVYEDTTEPFQYSLNNVTEGTYTITAKVVDAAGESNMAHARITVNAPSCSEGTGGLIVREIWRNIPGTSVSSIPVDSDYDDLQGISGFQTQTYYANDYGSRIRAQICVPQTGNYVFWIASDDNSELWLSTTAEPGNKVKIASVTGATKVQQWTKYASQQSAPIPLKAGYKYYIEALHKEANGNDHVEVGWQLPDGTLERPILANRLIAYSETGDLAAAALASEAAFVSDNIQDALGLYPNPAINREVALTVSGDVMQTLNNARVQVISATGEVVHTQTVKCDGDCNNVLLSLKENIRPGVYLVNVIMGRKRLSKKLMVE